MSANIYYFFLFICVCYGAHVEVGEQAQVLVLAFFEVGSLQLFAIVLHTAGYLTREILRDSPVLTSHLSVGVILHGSRDPNSDHQVCVASAFPC